MNALQRGQALIETAAFLPIMLLAMIAIIYFSQYGVLQTHAVEAVRYATLVTNEQSNISGAYTLSQMYAELQREGSSSNPAAPGLTDYGCSSAGTAAQVALYQAEPAPQPGTSAPASSPPYFQASSPAPVGTCSPQMISMPGNNSVANAFFIAQLTSITGSKTPPHFIQVMNPNVNLPVLSKMSLVVGANAEVAIYCNPAFGSAIAQSLGVQPVTTENTASDATAPAYANFPSPPAGATPRPNC